MISTLIESNNSHPWTAHSVYIVANAIKSSSTCRTCKDCIRAGNIQLGVIFEHPNGYVLIHWHHLTCWTTSREAALTLHQLEGLDLLAVSQRRVVQRWLEFQRATRLAARGGSGRR